MLSDFKSLAVADASGERVKMALLSSGAVVAEISRDAGSYGGETR